MENFTRILRQVLENAVLLFSVGMIIFFFWYLVLQGIVVGPPVVFYNPAVNDTSATVVCGGEYTHQTIKSEYRPGEYVTARINSVKKISDVGFINWNLNDADGNLIESYKERPAILQKLGENKTIVPVEKLPNDIKPGTYVFEGYLKYDMGFRVQYVHVITNKFRVIR